MSEAQFYAAVVIICLAVVGGFALGVSSNSASGELDKICYEQDPDWKYKADSALYWNSTLSIECVESVVIKTDPIFGNTTEMQVQATLELQEVDQ